MKLFLRYGLVLIITIALLNFFFILLFSWLGSSFPLFSLPRISLLFLAALLSASLVGAIIVLTNPLLKDFLTTFSRLLRLENLSHPLLLRLSKEAPGTYHHTTVVTNLAYRAAKAIQADAYLVRVGSYYHDIGKLTEPTAFIENQKGENIHQKIKNPRKSAQIIISHVKEGIKLAKENNLPAEVINFIPEHHGTTIVSYFYSKALEKNPKRGVILKDFRYPGPKPMSKETAVLMLADEIEAKIRTIPSPDIHQIQKIVSEIIEGRREERQLDFSGLTPIDLLKIEKSFVDSLSDIFHKRISYP